VIGGSYDNILSCLIFILVKVLGEQASKTSNFRLEFLGTSLPRLGGIQNLVGHTGTGSRNIQIEDVQVFVLGLGEGTVVDGIQDRTRILEWTTLSALGDGTSDPTGIDEPCISLVVRNLVRQHLGVTSGMQNEERLAEASGESSFRFRDTLFRTGHLGGVARDEVVHDLVAVELGDGGEDTAGITGQEDDVAGVAIRDTRDLGVGDKVDGVGATGVLREGRVVVIDETGMRIEHDVFKD